MSKIRGLMYLLVAGAVITAGPVQQAAAQPAYPSQNITMIVAFPAGGLADIIGRLVSTKLADRLKQKFVVENRGGAGGNLAARAVAGASADGYTLLTTTSALAVNHTATKNKGYETSDLRPVAIVAFSPDVLAVHPGNPAKDLKEFVANGKSKSFTYASAGIATGPQIGAEYFFKVVAKVQSVHVPFQGGAPAITAALGNHVDSLVLTLPPVTPHIRNGKLRGLGVASDKRNSAIPDVPTYGEMGFPNVHSGSWVGIFAPAKTADAIVAKLNADINAVMQQPDALQTLAKAGFDPVVKDVSAGTAYFNEDVERWATMIKATGVSK